MVCKIPKVCDDWQVQQTLPGCRLSTDKNVEQKCGNGKEYYDVTCPQLNMCHPLQKPSAEKPCTENIGCAWKVGDWPSSRKQLKNK